VKVFGISVVRDEVDVIHINILHHLALGLDRILVIDNGSSDGTYEVLKSLSRNKPIDLARNTGQYRQPEFLTHLARESFRLGADWILPIDADEFWCAASRGFRTVLAESNAQALLVERVNLIQRREQNKACPEALLSMTRRAARAIERPDNYAELAESGRISFVETIHKPKCVLRPSETVTISRGGHRYSGVDGPPEPTAGIVCLHAPLRARSLLELKAANWRRVTANGSVRVGPARRRWIRLWEQGKLDEEWAANSYADDCIDVGGERRPVVFDPRLRDLVAPWIKAPV
jgi:hypothetical protein